MWNLLLACSNDDSGPGRRDDSTIELVDHTGVVTDHTGDHSAGPGELGASAATLENGGDNVRLVQLLRITTEAPSLASLVIDDGVRARRVSFPTLATEHALPILELHPSTDYTIDVTVVAEDGRSATQTLSLTTAALDLLMPIMELKHNDGAEPGYRVIPIGDEDAPYIVLVVDEQAQPVYVLRTNGDTKSVQFQADGTWGMLLDGKPHLRTVLGDEIETWSGTRYLQKTDTPVDVLSMHHEALFEPDGTFWSLTKDIKLVLGYPTNPDNLSRTSPEQIDDDLVLHVAADGSILSSWSLAETLHPQRVSADSTVTNPSGYYDWGHANGIVNVPGENAILVSLRHQDAVVKLDATTGALIWILGNHDGWPTEFQPYLLEPVGTPFAWQFHQHGPWATADGRVILFDNGNAKRTTPYSDDPIEPNYSRLVSYQIDEVAKTITQLGEFIEGIPPLYASTLGNADLLPVTGHVLGTYSYLYREGGVINEDVGLGARSVRLLEADLDTGTKHWDLRLTSDIEVLDRGYQVDRASFVSTLYPPGVVEEWLTE